MDNAKKNRIFTWLKWLIPPLAIILLSVYFSLPFIVERMVLPQVAAAFGVEFFTSDVRNIDVNSIDLADVALGETPGGGQFKLDSVRIDYKLGFTGLEITRLRVSGVDLDLEMAADGAVKVAGKTPEQWLKSFNAEHQNTEVTPSSATVPSTATQQPADRDAPFFTVKVNRIELVHSQLHLTTPDFEWTLPFSLEAVLPSPSYPRIEANFRIEQARDNVSGNFFYDAAEKHGDFELSAAISIQRYLQLFPKTRDLPITGMMTMKLYGEFTDHVTSADFALSSRRLKYGDIAVSAAGNWHYDPEYDLPWRSAPDFAVTVESPAFALKLSDCAAWLSTTAKQVKLTAAATAKTPQIPEQRLDGEISVNWGKNLTAEGALNLNNADAPIRLNWDFSAAETLLFNAKLDEPAGTAIELTVLDNIKVAVQEPHLTFNAEKRADAWHYRCAATLKNLEAAAPDWRLNADAALDWEHGDHPYLRLNSKLAGKWREIDAAANLDLDLKTGATGITGGDCTITGMKISVLPTELTKFTAAFDLTPPQPGSRAVRRAWRADWDCGVHLAGMSAITRTGWLIDGSAWHGGVKPSTAVKFTFDITNSPHFLIDAAVQVPPTGFNNELIHQLVPQTEGWEISGQMSANADYRFGFGNNRGKADVKLINAGAENVSAGVRISGLDAEMTLPALPRLATAADQVFAVKSIRAAGVELNNLYIDYQLSPEGLFVTEAGIEAFGGSVTAYALNLKPGDRRINANLFCDGLKLADFINAFNFAHAVGSGRIYGRVPVSVGWDGIFVKRGYLYSEPGVREMFKLSGLNTGIDFANSGAVELDLAQEALRSFTYDWVKIDFSQDGEDLVLAATFSGKPDGDLPFTFDPDRGGFLRVTYPGARFQGIDLTLRWKLPLNRLLELNDKYDKLKERLGL